MIEEQPKGRRLLVATAISRYTHAPDLDRPQLVAARQQVIDLFTRKFGYTHLPEPGLNPTETQLLSQLRELCRNEVRPQDYLVVYLAGHGDIEENGQHVLLTADTDPGDPSNAMQTAMLARKMLLDTPVQRLLLMLDTCYSGQGGDQVAAAVLTGMQRDWTGTDRSGLVVVTSTQPFELAEAGAFPTLLSQAVDGLPIAGQVPLFLNLGAVVDAMNKCPDRPAHQQITIRMLGLTGAVPDFLPNPRHRQGVTDIDLHLRQVAEWGPHAARRESELRSHLLPRARGGHDPENAWWFCGRHAALTDITAWLTGRTPSAAALVVTGKPGSGKTAVLGLVSALAHPDYRRNVPVEAIGMPPQAMPPCGALDVTIYASGLTHHEVLAGLAAAAHITADTVGQLITALNQRNAECGRPFTALIDALDEAANPHQLVTQVLQPLIEHGQGQAIRFLLGTRPHLVTSLAPGSTAAPISTASSGITVDTIPLDDDRYADAEALTFYTMRNLLDAAPDSPYRNASTATIRAVADAVAEAAYPSFLVARITGGMLAAAERVADPTDPHWRACLPLLPGDAMRTDIDTRFGADADRVRDLLRPLAYTKGQGLPWEDIWAGMASAISGHVYTDHDLYWLREHAGSYVVESSEADRSVYRLYHWALAEHLRADTETGGLDELSIQRAFTEVLISRVPRTLNATRNWSRAHPYTLRHLVTHAAAAGIMDELLTDVDYLVHADPATLAAALFRAETPQAQLAAAIYRASVGIHRHTDPGTRRRLLTIDAARYGSPEFAQRFAGRAIADDWRPRWAAGARVHPALRDTLSGHTSWIRAVACTRLDGRPIAVTAGQDLTIRIWDLITGEQVGGPLTGHLSSISAVACAELDGQPIAVTGSNDQTVRIWDLTTSEPIGHPLTGHTDQVNAVACAELNGKPIAITGSNDRTVRIWDLTTSEPIGRPLTGHNYQIRALACTELGGRPIAITGGNDQRLRKWDLITQELLGELRIMDSLILAVACITLDGKPYAVIGGNDRDMRIWDLTTDQVLGDPITGHTNPIAAIACTTIEGQPVAITGSKDRTARVWDLTTGPSPRIHNPPPRTGHTNRINAVACTTVGSRSVAVTVSNDRTARVWDLATGEPVGKPLIGHLSQINAVACASVQGRPVAVTGSEDRTARVWDLDTGRSLSVFGIPIHTNIAGQNIDRINALACTSIDERPVAIAGCQDGTAWVWDLATGRSLGVLRIPTHPDVACQSINRINALACTSIDERPVAIAGCHDGTAWVWDLATGQPLGEPLTGLLEGISTVEVTELHNGPVAIVGRFSGTVQVWNLTTREHRIHGDIGPSNDLDILRAMACATVERRPVVITGGRIGTVHVQDLMTTSRQRILGERDWTRTKRIRAMARTVFDGHAVAVAGRDDGTVQIWDLTTGRQMRELVSDRTGAVRTVACTVLEEQTVVVSGHEDGIVQIWDLATGQLMREFVGDRTGAVRTVACTVLDEQTVAVSGGDDGTVQVWELATGQQLGEPFTSHPITQAGASIIPQSLEVIDSAGQPPCATGETPHPGYLDRITAVACLNINEHAVAILGDNKGMVQIWDLDSDQPGAAHQASPDRISPMTCTNVKNRAVAILDDGDGMVRIWDLNDTRHFDDSLDVHTKSFGAMAYTELYGRPIAVTGGFDGVVRIWDLTTCRPFDEPLTGHTSSIYAVACAKVDNRTIAVTGGNDLTVRVWDLITMNCQAVLHMPAVVFALSVAADGSLVVCVDRDVVVLEHIKREETRPDWWARPKQTRMLPQATDATGSTLNRFWQR